MNPCPCGYKGDPIKQCRCSLNQIHRYRSRISGPLLDRIDLHVEAPALSIEAIQNTRNAESSASIKERCENARAIQKDRYAQKSKAYERCNGRMNQQELKRYCPLSQAQERLLKDAMNQLNLSVRAYDRILKVARTIADLAKSEAITDEHLLEAIQYRNLDRTLF